MKAIFSRALRFVLIAILLVPFSASKHSPAGKTEEAPKLPRSLYPLIRSYPSSVENALRQLKRGVDQYEKDHFDAALEALPSDSSARATAVADLVLLYRAKAHLNNGRAEEAVESFRLLRNRYLDSPRRAESIIGESQALLELKQPMAALAVLEEVKLDEGAESIYWRGMAHEKAGDHGTAEKLYFRVYADFATSEASQLAREGLRRVAPKFATDARNYEIFLRRAENLASSGKNRDARRLLIQIARLKAPGEEALNRLNLLRGRVEYALGRPSTALVHFRKIKTSCPSIHAGSLYHQAISYRKMGNESSLLAKRDEALKLYPDSPFTEKLLYSVATYFAGKKKLAMAHEAYRALTEKFPKGQYSRLGHWKLGLYEYGEGNYEHALRDFWKQVLPFPEPRYAIAPIYWMGRCYEKLGDGRHARYLYVRVQSLANCSFYGQLAQRALEHLSGLHTGDELCYNGLNFETVKQTLGRIDLPNPVITEPSVTAAQVIQRAGQLTFAGLADLALAELRQAIRRFPDDKALSYVMSRVYESKEDFLGAIVSLRTAFPNYSHRPHETLPKEIWELLFPVRYLEVVSTQAERRNIAPALVLGVIRQESAFKSTARSRSNARGLMQLLPKTGRELARQVGVRGYSTAKLYQPENNIMLGTHYLASILQRFNDQEEVALAAYNAGPARVDRWLKEFGSPEVAQFVENIPLRETRNYVKQVLTSKAHYSRHLRDSPISTP